MSNQMFLYSLKLELWVAYLLISSHKHLSMWIAIVFAIVFFILLCLCFFSVLPPCEYINSAKKIKKSQYVGVKAWVTYTSFSAFHSIPHAMLLAYYLHRHKNLDVRDIHGPCDKMTKIKSHGQCADWRRMRTV